MIFTITAEQDGRTVLSFLKSTLKISGSALARLKRNERGILVNGKHVTVRYVLRKQDTLYIDEKDSEEDCNEAIAPVALPINVIFENDDITVVNKPPNMPTHPSHGHTDDTLANAVAYINKERNTPAKFRPIGRLDRNTSGLSLIARHSISSSFLYYARQKGLLHKKYIAILCGRIESDGHFHTVSTYMKREEDSVILRCVGESEEEGAYPAVTHWRLLFSCDEISVVEAIPETGRTHQLRVHFAHIGHPILGDDIYGTPSEHISRHALHAAFLSIPMPYTTEQISFTAPLPNDMIQATKAICGQDLESIYLSKFNK
jgi:23S rRNA pseudouridine1911/1915/1917 synthase